MVQGVRETKKGEKGGGEYFFPIFDNKLINGNKIEAYMQKIGKIAWKIKTWTPSCISLVIRGGRGESRGIGKGKLLLEPKSVENMYP